MNDKNDELYHNIRFILYLPNFFQNIITNAIYNVQVLKYIQLKISIIYYIL